MTPTARAANDGPRAQQTCLSGVGRRHGTGHPGRGGRIATGKTSRGDVVESSLLCGYMRSPGRLVLGKLACQAVFVISFYDLSRPIARPPFSAARTKPLPDQLRLGDSL